MRPTVKAAFLLSALSLPLSAARADEGMWTFDAFPAAKMKSDYGWAPDQAWLDKVRAGAVRLTGGCSASFVSSAGLILTNHHCVATCVEENSTGDNNILKNGYTAADRSRELKCAGQQAEVVTSIKDVTADVKSAIGSATGEAAVKARATAVAALEKSACGAASDMRCQVVTLYGGGQYKLYTYKKYSDVRLVWTPEAQAAQFGGDPDNFNFPRYSMDGSFLRAYDASGRPAATPQHLKWNPRAPVDGEATFVVGNPGSTARLITSSQLAFQREVALPITLATMSELRGRIIASMAQSPERAREAAETLGGIENSLKVYIGRVKALNDPAFVARLAATEADIRAKANGNAAIGDPWTDVAKTMANYRTFYTAYRFSSPQSDLFDYAQALVRVATEKAKPAGERLPGYSDSALPLTEKRLLDARPITPWLDQLMLEWSLSKSREYLGADDPQTKLLLGKESPEGLAKRLVSGTKLADPAVRKALLDGGLTAIQASDDPMIKYALKIDANDRALQARFDAEYDAPLTAAAAKLSDARFAAYGDSVYPDATFTLRISYGKVAGWMERGSMVPTRTVVGGTFDRATGAEPFDLPPGFVANKAKIDMGATYDFVTTNDIIGGNSGSPVIDKAGTVIGAAFDGNIHSLGGNYGYDRSVNRTVVVSTDAIQEALENIYPARHIIAELNAR